jgi:hypothetical protein
MSCKNGTVVQRSAIAIVLLTLLVFVVINAGTQYPPEPGLLLTVPAPVIKDIYLVTVNWIDGRRTTVKADEFTTSNGFLHLHITTHPVGWMFIPTFSISWAVILDPMEKPDDSSKKKLNYPSPAGTEHELVYFMRH